MIRNPFPLSWRACLCEVLAWCPLDGESREFLCLSLAFFFFLFYEEGSCLVPDNQKEWHLYLFITDRNRSMLLRRAGECVVAAEPTFCTGIGSGWCGTTWRAPRSSLVQKYLPICPLLFPEMPPLGAHFCVLPVFHSFFHYAHYWQSLHINTFTLEWYVSSQ